MQDNWVAHFRRQSTWNLNRFYGRAPESWGQFDEYNSQELRSIMQKFKSNVPHQRSPHAVKFEDRSQEEIERQERCARGHAWRLAKNILKLKETDHATFLSLTNEWCLPAPSVIKPEEGEFVVDSSASMHMLSRKDPNSAELETVKVSKSPTNVVTANGEVQTKEEATVYVKELYLFVILRADQWPETTTHQRWQTEKCNTANYVPIVVTGLSTSSSDSGNTYISNVIIAGSHSSRTASRNNKK